MHSCSPVILSVLCAVAASRLPAQARWHDPPFPAPRIQALGAYDPNRHVSYLLGGVSDGLRVDMHAWDGSSWHSVPVAAPVPAPIGSGDFDAVRDRWVVFAGTSNTLYEFDWTGWQARLTTTFRVAQPIYDSARGEMLVLTQNFGSTQVQMWRWNGVALQSRGAAAPPGSAVTAVFDHARGRLVLFDYGAMHEWDGTSWRTVPAVIPTLVSRATVFDP
jgi:hypothetical protein